MISERRTDENNMMDVANGFMMIKGEEYNYRRKNWMRKRL